MTELLPCPFCGGKAKVMRLDLKAIEEGWQLWGVWCDDDLNDEYSHGHYIDNYATEEEAIAAWNRMATDAEDVLQSIDQLRRDLSGYHGQLKAHEDLARHCENQRKRIGELEGLHAKDKAEMAELRELAERAWKTAERLCQAFEGPCSDTPLHGSTIHKPCPLGERDEECVYGLIQRDLRELGIEVDR